MSNSINMGLRRPPYAFTELGVAMLSSVLNSKIAIQVNIGIMRAFVYVRRTLSNQPPDRITELQQEVMKLKVYIEDVFSDYNDINEDTRMQMELISQSLAELQAANKLMASKPRKRIGFIPDNQGGYTK